MKPNARVNQSGRVVITLEQKAWASTFQGTAHTIAMALWHLCGGAQPLSEFDGRYFSDFVWRRLFGNTLPASDFDSLSSSSLRVARVPWVAMHLCGLVTHKLGHAMYPRLDTSDFDVMIAETPYPARVSRGTKLVIRYHDAIPLLMPHTVSDRKFHQASHYQALRRNVRSGATFVCVSEATREQLLSVFPEVESRTRTIHNMVASDFFGQESSGARAAEIVTTRAITTDKLIANGSGPTHELSSPNSGDNFEYLLMVSTVEPRKNHATLLAAWERLRVEAFPLLKLVMVGSLGWDHDLIVSRFRPWIQRNDVFFLDNVPSSELRSLYKHARAVVCPSLGEGFGLSGVEAMASGAVVVASDIPAHREVYADAAEYFNPYSPDEAAKAIRRVIDTGCRALREALVSRGRAIARRFEEPVITEQWNALLSTLAGSATQRACAPRPIRVVEVADQTCGRETN